ncbi:MAG: transglycosylase SLT domain-containing protein [Candidatus Edwardsbacteria bacterium]|nr:transglycosylase SLT domain-containing protein [Candidatus Edwardsbacteria bacterium]
MRGFLTDVLVFAFAAAIAAQVNPDAYHRAGTYFQWREFDRALALLDSIGTDSLAQPLRCRILLIREKHQAALIEATRVGILWPETRGGRAAAWQAAYACERLGRFDGAIAGYRSASARDTGLAEYARLRIERCFFKKSAKPGRKEYPSDAFQPDVPHPVGAGQGEDLEERLIAEETEKRPNALKLAAQYVRRKRYDKSRKLLADFIRAYPKSVFRGEAAYQIAKGWERQGRLPEALAAYKKVSDVDPSSDWTDHALFRQGWCQFKLGDTAKALETWRSAVADTAKDGCRDAARYWSAKLLTARGDSAAAHDNLAKLGRQYPYSFYGLKARGLWDASASYSEGLDSTVPFADQPHAVSDSCPILQDRTFQTGETLAEYGLSDDAASVLSRIEGFYRHDARSLYHLAKAYAACGRDDRAIDAAGRALKLHDGERPAELLALIYPRKYLGAIAEHGGGYGLDPALVLAVIHKESKFNATCKSWAGARGLMQIMPATGRLLAGDRKFKTNGLYDPLLSIRFGARYLAGMLREFDGSWPRALAAYNAGPGLVRQWLKDKRSRQDDDYFLEEIFVPETKRYVMVVMENYYFYRNLLQEEGL